MEATLSPNAPAPARSRVLAIEPDARRARTIKNLMRGHDGPVLEMVSSVDHALAAISHSVPELVLTSTFLPPSDERLLIARLKEMPGARHVQVINIPHFADTETAAPKDSRGILGFLRRKSSSARPGCDPRTLKAQIAEYLLEARTTRPELQIPTVCASDRSDAGAVSGPETALVPTGSSEGADLVAVRTAENGLARRSPAKERRVARRQRRKDLTWLWSVKLPWGTEVRVVDMSTTGVLMETTAKLAMGSTIELKLLGHETNITMPARAVRSEVAAVDALGVTYRIAAAFASEVDVPGLQRLNRGASLRPRTIADMLTRLMADAERCPGPAALRDRFVQELRQILPARDVQLLQEPASTSSDSSVYFAVPGDDSSMVLEVTFDPGYEPSDLEFRFMRAAANAAAVVLQFADFGMSGQSTSMVPFQAGVA